MADEDTNIAPDSDKEDHTELMKRLRRWFGEDKEHVGDWREQAYEDYAFVSGEQWAPEDVQTLKDQSRPVITFNRIDPLIRSVSGEQINNAQEIRYIPREQGDVKANEVLTSAAEWFREQCDADDEDSEAFWDAAICGMGWTESRLDFDDDPEEPNPLVERIDPFEMLWDKSARKRNLSDARRIWRVRQDIPIDEARDRYPDIADADLDASWARLPVVGKVSDSEESKEYEDNGLGNAADPATRETVTIAQCQWWEREAYVKVVVPPELAQLVEGIPPNGVLQLSEDEFAAMRPKLEAMLQAVGITGPLSSVKLSRRVYRQAFLGRIVLKEGKAPDPTHFTLNAITGFRDRNKGTFYGLVRSMKDPQRWANKWLSQTLHIMNVNAKGGVVMETGAVDNARQFEESYAKPGVITWVPDGTLSNPQGAKMMPKPVATFPAGFYQLMELAISSIRDTSGINLEMLGMREADQPASLELQRRQAGITILAPLFRSMRRYYRNTGKVLLYFIQNHLSDGRLVKIVGQEGAKYVPLAKQADVKYDIIVDEGPTSPNQKERVWALIGQQFWNLPPQIQMALLDYSPFPSSVVEKVKQAAEEASKGPQAELAQKMAQLEAELAQADVDLTKAKAEGERADAAKTVSEIGQDGSGANASDAKAKQAALIVDLTKHREKLAADVQMHREKLGAGMAMKASQPVKAGQGGQATSQPQPQQTDQMAAALGQIGEALGMLAANQRSQQMSMLIPQAPPPPPDDTPMRQVGEAIGALVMLQRTAIEEQRQRDARPQGPMPSDIVLGHLGQAIASLAAAQREQGETQRDLADAQVSQTALLREMIMARTRVIFNSDGRPIGAEKVLQ